MPIVKKIIILIGLFLFSTDIVNAQCPDSIKLDKAFETNLYIGEGFATAGFGVMTLGFVPNLSDPNRTLLMGGGCLLVFVGAFIHMSAPYKLRKAVSKIQVMKNGVAINL